MELWDNDTKKLFDSKDNISVKTYEYDAFQKTTKITVTTQEKRQVLENFYDAEELRYAVKENGNIQALSQMAGM